MSLLIPLHTCIFAHLSSLVTFIGGLSPFGLGSPAKSLRLQVCHIFCNPRLQPFCFLSACLGRLPTFIKAALPLPAQEYSFFRYASKFHTLVFFHYTSKKMRQTFVHTAEVVPALPHPSSSLYSPPFAQLAVGSRAQAEIHFVNIILYSVHNS